MDRLPRAGLFLLLLSACNQQPLQSPVDMEGDFAAPVDLSAAAPDLTLFPPVLCDASTAPSDGGGACDTAKFGCHPIAIGNLCDDVIIRTDDDAMACAIAATAPGFRCERVGNGWQCIWSTSLLDAAEYATLCRLTALPLPPGAICCMIYL